MNEFDHIVGKVVSCFELILIEQLLATKPISCSSCDIIDSINISVMPVVFFSFGNFVTIH